MKKASENVQSLIRASNHINNHCKAVEELVCNALDAGASSIAVRIDIQENTIQVIDNGCGVRSVDFKSIGQKYMTSGFIDLATLKSALNRYGFRGQSLANIINISRKVKVISREEKSEETWMKLFEYGKQKQITTCNTRPSKGTTIEVHGFLYNLSIQKKSNVILTELQNIKALLEHLSLVHSNISFSLRDDTKNDIIFKIHKNRDLYQTLSTLYSVEKEDYQELKVEKNEYKVTAFVGTSDKDSGKHFVFLNGKFLSNSSKLHRRINNNLSKYFKLGTINNPKVKNVNRDEESNLFQKKIPFYFIFIKCPYTDYDLNNSSKQSDLEFKDWNQVNKLLDKLIKFYNGDMSLKEVNRADNKEKQKTKDTDTRKQVKKIMEKILGEHPNKPGISHMHNGVKGKHAKRKTKTAKTTPKVRHHKEDGEEHLIISNNNHPKSKDDFETSLTNKTPRKKGLNKIKKDNRSTKKVSKTVSKPKFIQSYLKSIGKAYNSKFKKVSQSNEFIVNKIQLQNKPLFKKVNKAKRLCMRKDELIRKFEMETDSVKKTCNKLEKRTKYIFNRKDKRKHEVFVNENVSFANITKYNFNTSIRRQSDEIAIHDYNPRLLPRNKLNYDNNDCNNVERKSFQSNYDLVETILKSQKDNNADRQFPDKSNNSAAMINHLQPTIGPIACGAYKPEINIELNTNLTEPVATFQSHHYYGHKNVPTENKEYDINTNSDLQMQNNDIRNMHKRPRTFITKQSRDNLNSQRHNVILEKKYGFSKQFRSNLKRLFNQTSKLFRLKNQILGNTSESSYTIEFTESNYKVAHNKYNKQLHDSTRNPSRNIEGTWTQPVNYSYGMNRNNPTYKVADSKIFRHITDSTRVSDNIKRLCSQSVINRSDHKNAPISINTNTYTVSNIDNNGYTVNDNCDLNGTYTIKPSKYTNEIMKRSKAAKLDYIDSVMNIDDDYPNERNFISISNSQKLDQDEQILDPVHICETILHSQELINKEFELSFNNGQNNVFNNHINHDDPQKRHKDSVYGSYDKNKEINEDERPKEKDKRHNEDVVIELSHHFRPPNKKYEIYNARTVNDSTNKCILTSKLNKIQPNPILDIHHSQQNADGKIVKDSNIGDFNLKTRVYFLPKGLSPIYENCHTKNDCEYNLSEDYYEDEMYNNFVDNVRNNAEIFQPKLQGAHEHTTKAINKVNTKLNKDNSLLKFDGQSLKGAKILGQIDEKFIAAIMKGFILETTANFLILFDQHAVHERIRLEKNLSEYFNKNQWKPVKIDKIILKMAKDDILYLHNYKDKFKQLGLQWTVLNDNTVSLNTIPEAVLGKNARPVDRVLQSVKNLITEEITVIKMQGGCVSLHPKSIMDLVCSEACRYAIKFGDKLSKSECLELVMMLSDCKTPFQCAHGRPVMAVIMDIKLNKVDYKVNFSNIVKWTRKVKL